MTIAGMHCESGDMLVRDVDARRAARRRRPRHPGDRRLRLRDGQQLQRRAAAAGVFCSDGDARVVVRRETYEDLTARDV